MLSDSEAKAIVDRVGDELGLSPEERLAVRCVAKHETQYGAGWDAKHNPPRAERGAGSNNWGAITTTSKDPGDSFAHGDSRFNPQTGKVEQYQTRFAKHATPEQGARALALQLLFVGADVSRGRRENVAAALRNRSLFELAAAMRVNRYFLGTKPAAEAVDEYAAALERRYRQIQESTGERLFDAPKAEEGSGEGSGSAPERQSFSSAPQYLSALLRSLPALRRGVRGDLVAVLQFELGELSPDEVYGPKTQARVAAFQEAQGIESDVDSSGKVLPWGAVGVRTWAALFGVGEQLERSSPQVSRLFPGAGDVLASELGYSPTDRAPSDGDDASTPEQQAALDSFAERSWSEGGDGDGGEGGDQNPAA